MLCTGRNRLLMIVVAAAVAALGLTAIAGAVGVPSHRCGEFTLHAKGGITYRIEVLRNRHASCAEATKIVRAYWTSNDQQHGGPSVAASYYTIPHHPGWRCTEGAGGGACKNRYAIVGYLVH